MKIQAYTDFRELLDDKSIDVVTIATPNHWHSLMTILACQAGKDVFVQKPASHNLFEGRAMVTGRCGKRGDRKARSDRFIEDNVAG